MLIFLFPNLPTNNFHLIDKVILKLIERMSLVI